MAAASQVIELDDGSDIEISSEKLKMAPLADPKPKPQPSNEPEITCPVCMESAAEIKKANRKVSYFMIKNFIAIVLSLI